MFSKSKFTKEQAFQLILAAVSSGQLSFPHSEKVKEKDFKVGDSVNPCAVAAKADAIYLFNLYSALIEGTTEKEQDQINGDLTSVSA